VVVCETDAIDLTPGRCHVDLSLLQNDALADFVTHAGSFEVAPDDFFASGRSPRRSTAFVMRRHAWNHLAESSLTARVRNVAGR
jgi:lipopolysaccharide transport system ATP-binding protein